MSHEQRGALRQHLVFNLKVYNAGNGEFMGYLADIAPAGLMLLAERLIPVGQVLQLELRMQQAETFIFYDLGRDQHLRLWAESRWSRRENELPLYKTGFMLVGLNAAHSITIDYLIRSLRTDKPCDNAAPQQATHYKLCGLMLHLEPALDAAAAEHLAQTLKRGGVISVRFQIESPHLVVLQYHPERADLEQVLALCQTAGYQAQPVVV